MTANKKAPSWNKLHDWFVEKLAAREQGLVLSGQGKDNGGKAVFAEPPPPRTDYKAFLENASRTMIRFKKPEHLIKMIVKTID